MAKRTLANNVDIDHALWNVAPDQGLLCFDLFQKFLQNMIKIKLTKYPLYRNRICPKN